MGLDIHIQPVQANEVVGLRLMTFGWVSAVKVDGFQALINRWIKTFVTPKGSDPTDLGYGTPFGRLLESNMTDEGDMKDAVYLAMSDANDQVRQQDVDGMYPQEERLRDVTLLRVVADRGSASLEVHAKIVNITGKALVVRLSAGGDR